MYEDITLYTLYTEPN